MRMPNPNAPECDCNWLENAVDDPCVPIIFDSELNEYHLLRGGRVGGTMMIYHCPFCGGRTPKSHRDALFHHVTHEEILRVQALTLDLRTVDDVLAAFGGPDWDHPTGHGITTPGKDGGPHRIEYFRSMKYYNLSSTAVVDVIVHQQDRVHFTYTGKPVD